MYPVDPVSLLNGAALGGLLPVARFAVERGADLHFYNDEICPPLRTLLDGHISFCLSEHCPHVKQLKCYHLEVAEYLLLAGADPDFRHADYHMVGKSTTPIEFLQWHRKCSSDSTEMQEFLDLFLRYRSLRQKLGKTER
eukprot:CAMPEP_0177655654 /NCGR_PEP_ID=MMETSP0447-20121125/15100_1 /TAXON_ID=0 /ORGANISM="Stygamoeba regulata, Strain BSH-02190019" /LENGTH=138 /DNA_ID=CAMNT_0019159623 /DNA_START=324 /DNA_END=740 /DNA_ORIENTATION=-